MCTLTFDIGLLMFPFLEITIIGINNTLRDILNYSLNSFEDRS